MTNTTLTGRVWKFGDDINTDLIIPSFAVMLPRKEQPQYCFESSRPGWSKQVRVGDILLAGRNFGVGGGRNIGDVFLQLGITAVVAESFNGLGLRNCVNVGLPSLRCAGVLDAFSEGDIAEVDWVSGQVRNATTGGELRGGALPEPLRDIILAGGTDEILRKQGYLSDLSYEDRR